MARNDKAEGSDLFFDDDIEADNGSGSDDERDRFGLPPREAFSSQLWPQSFRFNISPLHIKYILRGP